MLTLLAALPLLAQAPTLSLPWDLELSSLVITDRIRGGIIQPTPVVRLALQYDRTQRVFRAIRCRDDPREVWVADLTSEHFRELLDLALDTGLAELPMEDPPGGMDVYGRNRQVRLAYRNVLWANGAPGGCSGIASKVRPSDEQRARFDDVVARLEKAVDALPLRRGDAQELERVPFFGNVRALRTYRTVMDHVLAHPIRHRLDLEIAWASENRVAFCWRGQASDEHDFSFVVGKDGKLSVGGSPYRRKVEPVETGMTIEEVVEQLGEPTKRRTLEGGDVLLVYVRSTRGWPREHVSRLRFTDGRLAAP